MRPNLGTRQGQAFSKVKSSNMQNQTMSKKKCKGKKENLSPGIHSSNHWANCPTSGNGKRKQKRKPNNESKTSIGT
jgi:hypothetical protein